jgi:peptidoglycan/xylan/chitin deacetylase (PgdA/CDA1 family)
MFFENEIIGDRLPARTLCFTYDDGPGRTDNDRGDIGPHTEELAEFLHAQGVPATFFVVGKFACEFAEILPRLHALGHLVANHTFDHPSLPAFVARGGDVHEQLARTDRAIREHVGAAPTFFRPPYGDWRLKGEARSNVAPVLNRSDLSATYVGPIGWDIDAGDVSFWRDDRRAEDCAQAYLEKVEEIGRGVILMHDSTADIDAIRPKNQALGLARALVPQLRQRGYRFTRLDAIPQVASAARVSAHWVLKAFDGAYLSAPWDSTHVRYDSPGAITPDEILGAVALDEGRCALRGANGLFLSARPDGSLFADAEEVGQHESFTIEPKSCGAIALRTFHGLYLTRHSAQAERFANATRAGERELFSVADP